MSARRARREAKTVSSRPDRCRPDALWAPFSTTRNVVPPHCRNVVQGTTTVGLGPPGQGGWGGDRREPESVSAIRACHWAVAVRLSASTPERRDEYAIRGRPRPYPSVPRPPGRWAGAPTHPPVAQRPGERRRPASASPGQLQCVPRSNARRAFGPAALGGPSGVCHARTRDVPSVRRPIGSPSGAHDARHRQAEPLRGAQRARSPRVAAASPPVRAPCARSAARVPCQNHRRLSAGSDNARPGSQPPGKRWSSNSVGGRWSNGPAHDGTAGRRCC